MGWQIVPFPLSCSGEYCVWMQNHMCNLPNVMHIIVASLSIELEDPPITNA